MPICHNNFADDKANGLDDNHLFALTGNMMENHWMTWLDSANSKLKIGSVAWAHNCYGQSICDKI